MKRVLQTTLIAGAAASLAMMPVGLAFRAAGLRVGYYGPKFAALYIAEPSRLILIAQHFVLGWLSALPLVLLIARTHPRWSPLWLGALYGAAYYIAVNSLALPLYFHDPAPWTLGAAVILPSLIVHLVFGVMVGVFGGRAFRAGASPS